MGRIHRHKAWDKLWLYEELKEIFSVGSQSPLSATNDFVTGFI